MVNKDKKFLINEGRQITNGNIFYGGFPRVLKEQGEGATKQFEDNPLDPSEAGTTPVATQPDSVDGGEAKPTSKKIKLMHGLAGTEHEFDVLTDEGLTKALQLIQGNEFSASMADFSSNVSEAEKRAIQMGKEIHPTLKELARQRKLKVTFQGFSKPYEVDYGAEQE